MLTLWISIIIALREPGLRSLVGINALYSGVPNSCTVPLQFQQLEGSTTVYHDSHFHGNSPFPNNLVILGGP